jgi:hypothetical protein
MFSGGLFGFCFPELQILKGHSLLGKAEKIDDFQNSQRIQDKYGNKPVSLAVFCGCPHGNASPG